MSAARRAGLDDEQLNLSGVAVLTFSKMVMDRLEALCGLEEATWIGPQHHPYAAARIVKRGAFEGVEVTALVPPMGSSPLACIVEDLAACGVEAVFLVCAAWSLGPPVQFGDLIIPQVSLGLDGTSLHYDNQHSLVQTKPELVRALTEACQAKGLRHHVGGNGSCEALYRITPRMAEAYRRRGCLCMDNGEANTLLAMSRALGILGGVLFHPYIDLSEGWNPARLSAESYRDTCQRQAEVVLGASTRLVCRGLLRRQE